MVVDRDYGAIGAVQNRRVGARRRCPFTCASTTCTPTARTRSSRPGTRATATPSRPRCRRRWPPPEGWEAFHKLAVDAGGGAARWAQYWHKRMRAQTRRRASVRPLRQRRGRGSAGGGQAHRRPAQLDPSERRAAEPAAGTGPRPLQPHRDRGRLRSRATDEPRRRQAAHPAGRDGSPAAQSTRFSSSLRAWVPQQPARHKRTIPAGLKKAPKKAAVTLSLQGGRAVGDGIQPGTYRATSAPAGRAAGRGGPTSDTPAAVPPHPAADPAWSSKPQTPGSPRSAAAPGASSARTRRTVRCSAQLLPFPTEAGPGHCARTPTYPSVSSLAAWLP